LKPFIALAWITVKKGYATLSGKPLYSNRLKRRDWIQTYYNVFRAVICFSVYHDNCGIKQIEDGFWNRIDCASYTEFL
jgi:hypothetical protein